MVYDKWKQEYTIGPCYVQDQDIVVGVVASAANAAFVYTHYRYECMYILNMCWCDRRIRETLTQLIQNNWDRVIMGLLVALKPCKWMTKKTETEFCCWEN